MYQAVIDFWFQETEPSFWWKKDEAFDQLVGDRFGRYPHRNVILGRQSTEEELAFLPQPGSSF